MNPTVSTTTLATTSLSSAVCGKLGLLCANLASTLPYTATSNLAIALLAISATVFIFAVTLLGNAIDRAREEESAAKLEGKKDFDLKINDLENKVKAARESGDGSMLEAQLEDLTRGRKKVNQQLSEIQTKYAALSLKGGFTKPASLFLLGLVLNEIAHHLRHGNAVFMWVLAAISIGFGCKFVYSCLLLVEEISAASDEYQNRKLANAFQTALAEHEKTHQESVVVDSFRPAFPLSATKGQKLEITFRANIVRGKHVEDASVWFFLPDGIGLITPPEKDSWRQNEEYVVPNIRTVSIALGTISRGTAAPGTLKISAPDTAGEYILLYTVKGKGYGDGRQALKLIVS